MRFNSTYKNPVSNITNQLDRIETKIMSASDPFTSLSLSSTSSEDRELWLYDEVSPNSVYEIIQAIREINSEDDAFEKLVYSPDSNSNNIPRKPIKLFINTVGGSVQDGFALISIIKTSKTPIHTYGLGSVISMGVPILAAGHKRFTYSNTQFMLHSVATMHEGTLPDLRISLVETEIIQKNLNNFIKNNSSMTDKDLDAIIDSGGDFYFTANDALEYKLVDELISYV